MFLLNTRFWLYRSFLSVLKNVPLPSGLYGFWWEISVWSHSGSLVCDKSLPSCYFKISLCLWLFTVWLQCAQVWINLSLSFLEFVELLRCVDSYFSSNLGSFGPLCFQIFSLLFFFLFLGSHFVYFGVLDFIPQLCSFFFILFLKLDRPTYFEVCWFFLLHAQIC